MQSLTESAPRAKVVSPEEPSAVVGVLVGCVVFLSAFLLFEVELLIAKYILPWFGGTPAVFTTCMLVFQVLLLLGYGYAHLLESRVSPPRQPIIHVLLLVSALGVMFWQTYVWRVPLLADARLRPVDSLFPVAHIVFVLLVSVALPFFVLSTTGPLLQSWWARMYAGSPYKWYALSNAGSLAALLAYPVFIEPRATLRTQALWWFIGFALFACAAAAITCLAARYPSPLAEYSDASAVPGGRRLVLWLLLSCCGSLLFLATTNQICQEFAVVPFLWVLPLSLYLLSFVFCFGTERPLSRTLWSAMLAAATLLVSVVLYRPDVGLWFRIAVCCFVLFSGCMVCHGELMRSRPSNAHLTSFYLTVAAGGAVGGVCITLIFPFIFKGFWEFHIGILACWALLCVLLLRDRSSWIYLPKPILLAFCVLLICSGPILLSVELTPLSLFLAALGVLGFIAFLLSGNPKASEATQTKAARFSVVFTLVLLAVTLFFPAINDLSRAVAVSRNFYGVLSVLERQDQHSARLLSLRHGATIHGMQYIETSKRSQPTAYFNPSSGIGLLLRDRIARSPESPLRIGVVGLGVGTIAAYARSGDSIRFYEINPEVVRLSYSGPNRRFTFLTDSPAKVDVVLGDARISLERELARNQPERFDVLAIDAFTGDSIPFHLLTREAFALYLKHLNPVGGVLAVHISNRYLDLKPVVAELAERSGKAAWLVDSIDPDNGRSVWVLVGNLEAPLTSKMVPLRSKSGFRIWTDDYSSLFAVLR